MVNSKIYEINFNPYWTVPASIIKRDLIPKMQADPQYTTKFHIRIYNQQGNELQPEQINWNSDEATKYMFREDPGDTNSLGLVKINFFSKDGVYMHDTPTKGLFNNEFRFELVGLRAHPEHPRADHLAPARHARLEPRPRSTQMFINGQRLDVKLGQAGAGLLGLRHRLGGPRRRRPFPERHLRPRRPRTVRDRRRRAGSRTADASGGGRSRRSRARPTEPRDRRADSARRIG